MNVETGKVYTEPEAVAAAEARGEKLVPVSKRVAKLLSEARQDRAANLRDQRAAAAAAKKARGRARAAKQKASRKANRRRR